MTSLAGRVYVACGCLLVFLVLWAGIAARPWATPARDARVAALDRREAAIRSRAELAQRRYEARWAGYRQAVAERGATPIARSGPAHVRIVELAPAATTRSS